MKIAIVSEGSTKNRNAEVVKALDGMGHEIFNLGMKNEESEPDLTYIETGFLAALMLNLKAVDFAVGGCGTGQGFINAVLQFPGTAGGLLCDPVDAFLYAKVNAGNVVSLCLNKGYGNLAGDINLRYLFEKLFDGPYGSGYPEARAEIQMGARQRLETLSRHTHKTMEEILELMDGEIIKKALGFPGIAEFIKTAPPSELKTSVLGRI